MGIFRRLPQTTPWRADSIGVATADAGEQLEMQWEKNLLELRAAKLAEAEVQLRRENVALSRQMRSIERAGTHAPLAEGAEPWADWSSDKRSERFARGEDPPPAGEGEPRA